MADLPSGEINVRVTTTEEGSVTTSGVQRAGAPGAGAMPAGVFGPAQFLPKGFAPLSEEQKQLLTNAKESLRLQNEVKDFNRLVLGVEEKKQTVQSASGFGVLSKWLPFIGGAFGIGAIIAQSKIISTFLSTSLTILGGMVDLLLVPFIPLLVPINNLLISLLKPILLISTLVSDITKFLGIDKKGGKLEEKLEEVKVPKEIKAIVDVARVFPLTAIVLQGADKLLERIAAEKRTERRGPVISGYPYPNALEDVQRLMKLFPPTQYSYQKGLRGSISIVQNYTVTNTTIEEEVRRKSREAARKALEDNGSIFQPVYE